MKRIVFLLTAVLFVALISCTNTETPPATTTDTCTVAVDTTKKAVVDTTKKVKPAETKTTVVKK